MINEHQDNHFIKEQDKVEKYLLRIIQRYFDIEHNFTKESIEAMIIESLTRFKQMMISEKGFIFSLNKQTGNLSLTIRDFGGEHAFTKKTAFNKNFGTADNTICEGNDSRLLNDREPIEHVHEFKDINNLTKELEKINLTSGLHSHKNKNVLDLLRYSGTQTQIDLAVLEYLQKEIDEYIKNLNGYNEEINIIHEKDINIISLYLLQLKQILADLNLIINLANDWLQKAYKYTDNNVQNLKDNTALSLSRYLTKEKMYETLKFLNDSYQLISDGEIPIVDGSTTFTAIQEGIKTFEIEVIIDNNDSNTDNDGEGDDNNNEDDDGNDNTNETEKDVILNSTWINNAYKFGEAQTLWESDAAHSLRFGGGSLTENITNSYPRIVYKTAYKNYVHRVTLKSNASGNDCVSVVLAQYDDGDVEKHLSLVIGAGGVNDHETNNVTAEVILNAEGGNYKPLVLDYELLGQRIKKSILYNNNKNFGWNDITNGVAILIEKNNNILKIWIQYNDASNNTTWLPDSENNINIPTEEPLFVVNLNDAEVDIDNNVVDLSAFAEKCNYGYGTFSQPACVYEDAYFYNLDASDTGNSDAGNEGGTGTEGENPGGDTGTEGGEGNTEDNITTEIITIQEPYGYTNFRESNEIEYMIPEEVLNDLNDFNIKFFFKFDENGNEITFPLPVSLKDNNGNQVIIQASFNKEGKVSIYTDFLNKIQLYAPEFCLYNEDTLIIPTYANPNNYSNSEEFLKENNCTISLINSEGKNNFVKNILSPNREYYIRGHYFKIIDNNFYTDGSLEKLEYTDWDSDEPKLIGVSRHIKYGTSKKWKTADGLTENIGVIAEYKPRKLTQFFTNPRVYYQVLGNKEVIKK